MEKLNIKACPLCGSARLKQTMTCTDCYASGESFDLYSCEDCGFLFTQGAPVETEIGRYYETPEYVSHSDTHKGLVNMVYHWVRVFMLERKARLVQEVSHCRTGRLLDIGTGTGYFADKMRRKGWQVEAVEKNAQARAFAKEHFGLEVKADSELNGFASHSFQVITLWHVLEHLERLNETWALLHRLLVDNGVLLVAVPNSKSFDAGFYHSQWAAYDVPRHLWHFTPDSITRFALKHNFVLAGHYPMPFDAFYVSVLSEKNAKRPFAFMRGMCTGIRAWLASLGHKEKSSSMIYVFRKK